MESATQSSCFGCTFRPDRVFCDMPQEALHEFDGIKEQSNLAKGSTLFTEGRPSRGIFVLCDGRAKLSITSEHGKRLMLKVAGPGEVLGLGATLSGSSYEVTAELLDSSQVVFIRRKELLKFLRERPGVCMTAVHMLSQDLHAAYERVRSIGMGRTRRARLVRPGRMATA